MQPVLRIPCLGIAQPVMAHRARCRPASCPSPESAGAKPRRVSLCCWCWCVLMCPAGRLLIPDMQEKSNGTGQCPPTAW